MTGALRGHEQNIVARGSLDLAEVKVEAVARHQHGTLLQVWLDRRLIDVALQFVGQEDVDDVGLLDGLLDAHRREAVALGKLVVGATRPLGHDDGQAAVAEVLGLGVSLRAIADDGDGLACKGLQVGVGIVIDRGSQGFTPIWESGSRMGKGRRGRGIRPATHLRVRNLRGGPRRRPRWFRGSVGFP